MWGSAKNCLQAHIYKVYGSRLTLRNQLRRCFLSQGNYCAIMQKTKRIGFNKLYLWGHSSVISGKNWTLSMPFYEFASCLIN